MTNHKVGFTDPDTLGLDPGIEPTETFLDSVQADYRTDFTPEPISGNLNFRVIFFDFHNQEHESDFVRSDIDSMFFSKDFYYHTGNNSGVTAPNGDDVFGSFTDYWDEVSYGDLSIGIPNDQFQRVLNDTTQNDIILWNRPDTTVDYTTSLDELQDIAYDWITENYDEDILDSLYLGIILSGSCGAYASQELRLYRACEDYSYDSELVNHIGLHSHEFGHVLGLPHTEYYAGAFWNKFDIMSQGYLNGPEGRGGSPAHLRPGGKTLLGWLNPTTINGSISDTLAAIVEDEEAIYKMSLGEATSSGIDYDEYFLFENRQYLGFDYYLPGGGSDYGAGGDSLGGLLIWHEFWQDGIIEHPMMNMIEPTFETTMYHPYDNASEQNVNCTAVNFLYDGYEGDQSNPARDEFNPDSPRNSNKGLSHAHETNISAENITSLYDGHYKMIVDFYAPQNLIVANRQLGSSTSNLNGTLSVDNLTQSSSEWDYDSEASEDTVLVLVGDSYSIFTDQPVLSGETHYRWLGIDQEYKLMYTLQMPVLNEMTAWFDEQDEISIKSNHPAEIQIHDPWYAYWSSGTHEWIQPDDLKLLSDVATFDDVNDEYDYDVFKDQNPTFESNIPIYQLCAPRFYADTSAIFEFDYWSGTDVDYGTQDTTDLCLEVVFEEANAKAQAYYDTISYNSVLTLDEDLTIPAGAEYSLGGSFRIDIEEGSTLKFDGEVDNPISLQPSSSANGWDGIRVKDSSNVKLIYTKVIGADIGLDIQSDNENIHDIVNNTFAFCDTAIKIHEDDFDDLDITNNILHQNDVGIELKFYDGSSTGVGSELELKNNIFYDNTTTYIEEHDCTTNCYSSSGLLYENPDLKDVDEATEKYDCTLQWVSPCINGGASGMTADPDNTVIDIGAYYFHITLGDLNADTSWDVSDVTVLQGYILEPDPATPTSTMLDIGDTNTDTDIDVLDIVVLVTCIQNNDCDELERTTPLSGSANLLAYQPESLDRSEGEAIVISIESDVPVYGLQFDLEFETSEYDLYNIEQTDATEGFELEYRDYGDGTVRVLSYSLEAESIPTGINEVLIMNLNGLERGESNISYTVVNAKVSDEHGNNLLLSGNDPANTAVPTSFALHQAYPNPFNPETTIRYDLPVEADINITVYDIMGRPVIELVNSHMSPGYHRVTWNAKNNASGVYFIKLQTPGYTQTQKVMLVK